MNTFVPVAAAWFRHVVPLVELLKHTPGVPPVAVIAPAELAAELLVALKSCVDTAPAVPSMVPSPVSPVHAKVRLPVPSWVIRHVTTWPLVNPARVQLVTFPVSVIAHTVAVFDVAVQVGVAL